MIKMLDEKGVSTSWSSFPKYSKMKRDRDDDQSPLTPIDDDQSPMGDNQSSSASEPMDDFDDFDKSELPNPSKKRQTDEMYERNERNKIYEEIKNSTEKLLENPMKDVPSLFMGGVLIWNGLNTLASLEGLGGQFPPIEQVSVGYKSFLAKNRINSEDYDMSSVISTPTPMTEFPGKKSALTSIKPNNQQSDMFNKINQVNDKASREVRRRQNRDLLLRLCRKEIEREDLEKEQQKRHAAGEKLTEGEQPVKSLQSFNTYFDNKFGDKFELPGLGDDFDKQLNESMKGLDAMNLEPFKNMDRDNYNNWNKISVNRGGWQGDNVSGVTAENSSSLSTKVNGQVSEGGDQQGDQKEGDQQGDQQQDDEEQGDQNESQMKVSSMGNNTYYVELI